MTDVLTLRVDKYFYLSTCTESLGPCLSFLVSFHPKTDLLQSQKSLRDMTLRVFSEIGASYQTKIVKL
jgi:hypothetical protein